MATLVLGAAGAAVGGSLFPAGVSVLGATISGAAIGQAAGALLGGVIDRTLLTTSRPPVDGPRLDDLQLMTSTEGAPVPRLYGTARLAGQIIWATRLQEHVSVSEVGGGKGGGGGGQEVRQYSYSVSLAIGLCEGPVTGVGRIWADGQPLPIDGVLWRLHNGDENQVPDSLIVAVEGAGRAPAYRGLAYVVFEDFPLQAFGNRVPQFTFEVSRAPGSIGSRVRAVTLIPGATEYGYDPKPQRRTPGGGIVEAENSHNASGGTDWNLALDQLSDACPNCRSVALVVSWFGSDLRCASCRIEPRMEDEDRRVEPDPWRVSGISRSKAARVSQIDERPAFGGTPSDDGVIRALRDLRARGHHVTFYPFLLMDIPAGNRLPDPRTAGQNGQPPYPWRGRITCDPAPGLAGSPDATGEAAAQVRRFFGDAGIRHFQIVQGSVRYTGPDTGGYRRMILHYAHLVKQAGGVDAFLIGSELRGLTTIRSARGVYPAVQELVRLARDVKAIVGSACRVSYAADWTEFFNHRPADSSNDLTFHLDELWADEAVGFIGVDWYQPLADWRDGVNHEDARAGHQGPHDLPYLMSNITAGENYDWYYASPADRIAQRRTPIRDTAYDRDWVFRSKDLVSWWSRSHHNRQGGREAGTPTAWRPRSKPIWFTEMGCPAVDRGANQPNLFPDAKSSEDGLPWFSRGHRDDLAQARYLEALVAHFDPLHSAHPAGANPVSPVYGGSMVDPARLYVWTWDARPAPFFPQLENVWSDGRNWSRGHWLNGRLGAVPLASLVAAILDRYGITDYDVSSLEATGQTVQGYVVDRPLSAREALEPLMRAFFVDAVESGGVIRFMMRDTAPVLSLARDDLAEDSGGDALARVVRNQESDLPAAVKLTYIDSSGDYRQATVEASRPGARGRGELILSLPMVLSHGAAHQIARRWLAEAWESREEVSFALSPAHIALEPGDCLSLETPNETLALRVTAITDDSAREVRAVRVSPRVNAGNAVESDSTAQTVRRAPAVVASYGPAHVRFLDLPLLRGDERPHAPHVAATARPWPGGIAVYRSTSGEDFTLGALLDRPAVMGETLNALPPGAPGRWQRNARLQVRLWQGVLSSGTMVSVLQGKNAAAIAGPEGTWEIIQFLEAELVAPDVWQLSGLLRGLAGTESRAVVSMAAGADFVLLNDALQQPDMPPAARGLSYIWRYGPAPVPISDGRYISEARTFGGQGLVPLAPVHPRARMLPSGDMVVGWTRRSRINADAWDGGDIPLGEESEHYEVDIMGSDGVVRTLTSSRPRLTYPVAQRLADSGGASHAHMRIHQVSAAVGRGFGLEVQFYAG